MLPKPEKTRKIRSEQLDLVKSIDDSSKSRRKLIILIISLLLTIGLSLGLLGYRHLKPFFAHPDLSTLTSFLSRFGSGTPAPPSLPPSSLDLGPVVDPVISSSSGVWSFIVSDNGRLLWQRGSQQLLSNGSSQTSPTLVSTALPQGLQTKETVAQTPDTLQDIVIITLPGSRQLQITINVTHSSSQTASRDLFAPLVKAIYWAVVQNN